MDETWSKKVTDFRSSSAFSDFSASEDPDEIEDPISAYFKQRCRNSSKGLVKNDIYSDRDSSFGIIDVENVSLFGDEDIENKEFRLSVNLKEQFSNNSAKPERHSEISKALKSTVESELDKQRELAQKALSRLSSRIDESQNRISASLLIKNDSTALADISSKVMNMKLSTDKAFEKEWFEPNFSPHTPRYFNDELSSFGGDNESFLEKNEIPVKDKKRLSTYAKTVSSLLKDQTQMPLCPDVEFESRTEEEQINRFEEDEKKFRLENSGLLHNSQISQFSDDGSLRSTDTITLESKTDNKLSIGQFFNLRSNRISSLVGSTADIESVLSTEEQPCSSTFTEKPKESDSKSECSFPNKNAIGSENRKVRRCASTFDLKQAPEVSKTVRYSSDSSSSNSTVVIQDIIAEMESGLSGTQIYEKLMKSYGKRVQNEKPINKEVSTKDYKKHSLQKNSVKNSESVADNEETPKSSKVSKRKTTTKSKSKDGVVQQSLKEKKELANQSSIISNDREKLIVRDLKLNETIPSIRDERIKKIGKGFLASTPKNTGGKSLLHKQKGGSKKSQKENNEREPPRVNSVLAVDLTKCDGNEDNEKTLIANSFSPPIDYNKHNNTVVLNETLSLEDTIRAGDLTLLAHKVDEMKRDSVCIIRPENQPVLLDVIQKLANFPPGSVDCSALPPILRDEFPELLSDFPTPPRSLINCSLDSKNLQDALSTLPDSWVKLPDVWGQQRKIFACADVEKVLSIPIENISKRWLVVSLRSVELILSQGKTLIGVEKGEVHHVLDFAFMSLKRMLIPPGVSISLRVSLTPKVPTKLVFIITFNIIDFRSGDAQTRNMRLMINTVNPKNYISVLPKDAINFGVIGDQCQWQTNVQVCFDGISELPMTVYIEEDESVSRQFILKSLTGHQLEKKVKDNIYHHVFHEGDKQELEFRVAFIPNMRLKEDSTIQEFHARLILMLGNNTETDGILQEIPIKGSVGFAGFIIDPSCNPLVFKASERGRPVTKAAILKNVGLLPIAFAISVENEDGKVVEDDAFIVPETFYLSRNETSEMNITFNARGDQEFIKRCLNLHIKPNGRVKYKIELIGIINTSLSRPLSRSSTVSTKSIASTEPGFIKLLTTSSSLSWSAVPLEKESRQTFQIKSLSSSIISIRISFEKHSDAFKLVNESGEKVHKLRKVLKPDCPIALTVMFRPDVLGPHVNSLMLETSHLRKKKMVPLNGIGGVPNIAMRNVKPDLNGGKILRLQQCHSSNHFESRIEFTNLGKIPSFLVVKLCVKDFSLHHELVISPSNVVLAPGSSATVLISQKLRNNDLWQMLVDKEICKIATVCVLSGDEFSRLRIKKLLDNEKIVQSGRLQIFNVPFHGEKELQLDSFLDSPDFETEFLKNLKVHEIAVVIEKSAELCDPSILEESTNDFVSFMSYDTVICTSGSSEDNKTINENKQASNPVKINATVFSVDSLTSEEPEYRITDWLETLDSVK